MSRIFPRAEAGARLTAAEGRRIPGHMSTPAPEPIPSESPELPVEELLRRARPLPPYDEMAIDDLTPEEAEAFLAAVLS